MVRKQRWLLRPLGGGHLVHDALDTCLAFREDLHFPTKLLPIGRGFPAERIHRGLLGASVGGGFGLHGGNRVLEAIELAIEHHCDHDYEWTRTRSSKHTGPVHGRRLSGAGASKQSKTA